MRYPIPITQHTWPSDTAPVVSILCAAYNHESFICDCINGFLIQETTFPVEIFVHDDASTDRTRETIQNFANKYPNLFRTIFQEKNQRSQGKKIISLVFPFFKGQYVAFCEGDDYWTDPRKLQRQVEFLNRNKKFSICFHEAMNVNEEGNFISFFNKIKEEKVFSAKDIVRSNFISTASCIFRKNYPELPTWYEKMLIGDWPLHVINAERGDIFYMPICMSAYRQHKNGVWSSISSIEKMHKGIKIMKDIDQAFNYKYHKEIKLGIRERKKKFGKSLNFKFPFESKIYQKIRKRIILIIRKYLKFRV